MVTMMFNFLEINNSVLTQEKKQQKLIHSAKSLFRNINLQHLEKKEIDINNIRDSSIFLSEEDIHEENIQQHVDVTIIEPFKTYDKSSKEYTVKVEEKRNLTTELAKAKEDIQKKNSDMLNALLGQ